MSITEVLLVSALILILIDIFFASDIPTHIAWICITVAITLQFNTSILYQILIALLVWFALVAFHYTLWRKVIEKINDRFIAPRKHIGGIEGMVGQTGVIKKVEGKHFLMINDELHQFETTKAIAEGESCIVINVKSNKLVI